MLNWNKSNLKQKKKKEDFEYFTKKKIGWNMNQPETFLMCDVCKQNMGV